MFLKYYFKFFNIISDFFFPFFKAITYILNNVLLVIKQVLRVHSVVILRDVSLCFLIL